MLTLAGRTTGYASASATLTAAADTGGVAAVDAGDDARHHHGRGQQRQQRGHLRRGVRDTEADEAEPILDRLREQTPFRFLDDMQPVAPMDSVNVPSSVTTLGIEPMHGEHHDALFLPPYRNPEPFPTKTRHSCNCKIPKKVEVTREQEEWTESVAKQLGLRVDQLPQPMSPEGRLKCTCTGHGDAIWSRVEPIPNTRNFTLEAADITYPAGNYWAPHVKDGLAAPEDKLPLEHYPLQAPSDRIVVVPGVSREDRVAFKYARYMDQVEERSHDCDGDGVSDRCVTDCRPGDAVEALLGSTSLPSRIVSTHVGLSAVIEYVPVPAHRAASTVDCPLQAGCTAFRVCRKLGSWCVQQEAEHPRDFLGNLHLHMVCPRDTQVCRSVQQLVAGKLLRKDGKACRPQPPLPPAAAIQLQLPPAGLAKPAA